MAIIRYAIDYQPHITLKESQAQVKQQVTSIAN